MSDDNVSRRAALKLLGVGVAGAAVTRTETSLAAPGVAPSAEPLARPEAGASLVAPLVAGSVLARWRVEQVLPVTDGATSVVLSDAAGVRFQLDICKRDASLDAPRGPGSSEHFEIFLANEGDGSTGTHEDHGLAAMALAEVVRGNEARVALDPFLTLKERVAADRARRHVV